MQLIKGHVIVIGKGWGKEQLAGYFGESLVVDAREADRKEELTEFIKLCYDGTETNVYVILERY